MCRDDKVSSRTAADSSHHSADVPNTYDGNYWTMIGITKLLCGPATPGDALRYGRDSSRLPAHLLQFSADKKPIVVWNSTMRCNLKCIHCYASATTDRDPDELTTEEGRKLIDDLVEFGAPVLLFSGGEPLT